MTGPRVVHLVPAMFGEGGVYGGGERYAFELARAMARVTPTTLVSFGDRPQHHETLEGLQVRVLGPAWRVRGQEQNRVHLGICREVARADIVHCHQSHTLAAELVALLGRASGRRVVTSNLGGGGWAFSGYLNTDRWFNFHLHISEYSRRIAGHADWDRAAVIYGGVDTDMFAPDPAIPKEPLVVYVGRLMRHKGLNDLVEALPGGMTLELIGRPYDDRFVADLKKRAAGKSVLFRHDCGDTEVVQAYRRARCVVLPSVYRDCYGGDSVVPELLGQTLIEGMSCGLPAVCTDVASMPEVVAHGQTGFVVPPNDPSALRALLEWVRDHTRDAERMGRAARQRVLGRFTWPSVVQRCLQVYGV